MNITDIRMLYDYTDWANHLVLGACEQLGDEGRRREFGAGHRSIHGTLVHMLWADWLWLGRWLGESRVTKFQDDDFADVAAISGRWRQVEEERRGFISSLRDEDLPREVRYRNTRGEPFAYPLAPLMQHVANHATHHRGQVVGMIRQFGAEPPATDLLFYFAKPQ
jgi:uncharacterized damage-inducible protein DinB